MPVFCYHGCLCLAATDAHTPLPWMPICYHGCLYPATTDARTLLPRMPVLCYHGCPYLATMDAHISCYHGCLQFLLSQKEVTLLTQFIGPFWLVASASRFLTSMRHWACSPVPTILGIRGSLRCITSLLISWESQLTSAHLHTGRGHYRSRDPFGGSAQSATCILPMQTFSHRMQHNSAMQSCALRLFKVASDAPIHHTFQSTKPIQYPVSSTSQTSSIIEHCPISTFF